MGVRRVGLKVLMKNFLSSSQAPSFILLVSVQCCVRDFCMYLWLLCVCVVMVNMCVYCAGMLVVVLCVLVCVCVLCGYVYLRAGIMKYIHSLSLCYAVRNV